MTGEDDEDNHGDRPSPLMTRWFWLALIFGLGCIIAGLAMAKLGPRYL